VLAKIESLFNDKTIKSITKRLLITYPTSIQIKTRK
jgi:hypothetical protein